MERFYDKNEDNEDDDEENDEPFFGSEDEDESLGFIDQQGIIDVMQMDLAQTELSQQLLSKAMEIARQNWCWYFKSMDTRMTEIETIYKRLLRLIDNSEEE